MNRVNLLIIDQNMNTIEVNLPTFMLSELNIDLSTVTKHSSRKDLNNKITEFLKNSEK